MGEPIVTVTIQGDRVSLDMTRDQYDSLMTMLGFALGAVMAQMDDRELFYSWLRFHNELNNGRPDFIPYEIPGSPV